MGNQALVTSREIIYIPLGKIGVNPSQPRRFFDQGSIDELAQSIRQYGVLQPVSVRMTGYGQYELVAGERRLRASKEAGLLTIPAIVINISDEESAFISLIENLQRQDLNYIEEAEGYVRLLERYSYTQERLAEKLSKSQSAIANKIRLLKLSRRVRAALINEGLSERHARALLKLCDEHLQLEVIRRASAEGLTVIQTEKLVESMVCPPKKQKPVLKVRYKIKDVRIFVNSIKQTVEIIKKSGFETAYKKEESEDGIEYVIRISLAPQ